MQIESNWHSRPFTIHQREVADRRPPRDVRHQTQRNSLLHFLHGNALRGCVVMEAAGMLTTGRGSEHWNRWWRPSPSRCLVDGVARFATTTLFVTIGVHAVSAPVGVAWEVCISTTVFIGVAMLAAMGLAREHRATIAHGSWLVGEAVAAASSVLRRGVSVHVLPVIPQPVGYHACHLPAELVRRSPSNVADRSQHHGRGDGDRSDALAIAPVAVAAATFRRCIASREKG
jgi:hypothetical protein